MHVNIFFNRTVFYTISSNKIDQPNIPLFVIYNPFFKNHDHSLEVEVLPVLLLVVCIVRTVYGVGDPRFTLQCLFSLVNLILEFGPLLIFILFLTINGSCSCSATFYSSISSSTFTYTILTTRVISVTFTSTFSALNNNLFINFSGYQKIIIMPSTLKNIERFNLKDGIELIFV